MINPIFTLEIPNSWYCAYRIPYESHCNLLAFMVIMVINSIFTWYIPYEKCYIYITNPATYFWNHSKPSKTSWIPGILCFKPLSLDASGVAARATARPQLAGPQGLAVDAQLAPDLTASEASEARGNRCGMIYMLYISIYVHMYVYIYVCNYEIWNMNEIYVDGICLE